jgi:hypothetical protein
MTEELRAGPLSAALEGADMIDVRWGSLDVASRVHVTVRDPDWTTVEPVLKGSSIERSADAFVVHLDAAQDGGDVAFVWHGIICGRADGLLTFEIEGVAERDFDYRRIGIVVLHPWRTYVDAPFEAVAQSGSAEGTFPRDIAPQALRGGRYHPMIDAFSELRVRLPGEVGVVFAFDGEEFELEDQRNWTDPTFKTYPTPLTRSEPRPMRAGERVVQSLTTRIDGSPQARTPGSDDGVTVVHLGDPLGRPVPPIGLSAPTDLTANPAHIRVEIDVSRRTAREPLEAAAGLGVPIELALLVDDASAEIDAWATTLSRVKLARLIVQLADRTTTPGRLVRSVRARLDGVVADDVPVVGGTRDHFSELNRTPPDGAGVDAIAFSISPTVHASDERSILETLEIQGDVVRRARELANGLPIVVSPVMLPRHLGRGFADAWTIGSVAAFAAAGAESITYTDSTPALAVATALRGEELIEATSSHPQRVAVVATGGARIIVNLTPRPERFRFAGGDEELRLTPYEVRSASP